MNDLPGLHHNDFLRDKLHIGNNMRRQDYNAVFGKGTNQIAETDALFRVKPRRRLV